MNLEKSHIMAAEVELLGFTSTQTSTKPMRKRIDAILKLAPLRNVRGCRRIIGIIKELTKKDVKFK